jgi:hypothetical protein
VTCRGLAPVELKARAGLNHTFYHNLYWPWRKASHDGEAAEPLAGMLMLVQATGHLRQQIPALEAMGRLAHWHVR